MDRRGGQRVPTADQLTHRKGLEERVLELDALHRKTALALARSEELLARERAKCDILIGQVSTLKGEVAEYGPLKAYSGDLQSRLTYAERELAAETARVAHERGVNMGLARELDAMTRKCEAAAARAASAEAELAALNDGVANLGLAKARAASEFGEEKGALAEALQRACVRVELLEGERDELVQENARLVKMSAWAGVGGRTQVVDVSGVCSTLCPDQ